MLIPTGFTSLFLQEVNRFTQTRKNDKFFVLGLQTRKMQGVYSNEFDKKGLNVDNRKL